MTWQCSRRFGAAMAALWLLPGVAFAGDRPATPHEMSRAQVERPTPHDSLTDSTPRDVRREHAPGPQIPVNERITRDLGNGCEYVATLTGMYRTRRRGRGVSYDPSLTLDAHVRCANGMHAGAPPARIRGRDLTIQQFQQRLAMHGRVVAPSNFGECAYTPSFAVSASRIEARAVWQACSRAMGGGPRSR